MTQTQSIINSIQKRVRSTDTALKKFQETYQKTVPILQADTQQFGEALRALGEVKNILDEIQSEMAAGVGHLVEEQESLERIEHDHAHAATLIIHLIEVYMQSDYSILVQALETIEPEPRRKALEALTKEQRKELLEVLLDMRENG